jgi:hypothetical protein
MLFRSNQVITILQARDLLGDEALTMTDEEVQKMIKDFDVMAQYAIGLVQDFKEVKGKTD